MFFLSIHFYLGDSPKWKVSIISIYCLKSKHKNRTKNIGNGTVAKQSNHLPGSVNNLYGIQFVSRLLQF